jgi:hypothetical protein
MNTADIGLRFEQCITKWNRRLAGMDYGGNVRSRFLDNPNVDDWKYYVNHLDTIGHDYIKKVIKYGNDVIEQLQKLSFQSCTTTREKQIECMRNMATVINEIEFPKHENRSFRGVGKEMIFLEFPLKNLHVTSYGSNYGSPTPPYDNWDPDIPKLVIERINCYLDLFKSLLEIKEQERRIEEEQRKNELGVFNSLLDYKEDEQSRKEEQKRKEEEQKRDEEQRRKTEYLMEKYAPKQNYIKKYASPDTFSYSDLYDVYIGKEPKFTVTENPSLRKGGKKKRRTNKKRTRKFKSRKNNSSKARK